MTEDEAEGFLRALQGILVELGAAALSDQARSAAREQGDELDSRAELALLLDEFESVLVDAPRMLKTTLGMLGAERLTFSTDPSDTRFDTREGLAQRPTNGEDEVTITMDKLGPLLSNAEQASDIIAELRRRLYE